MTLCGNKNGLWTQFKNSEQFQENFRECDRKNGVPVGTYQYLRTTLMIKTYCSLLSTLPTRMVAYSTRANSHNIYVTVIFLIIKSSLL